MKRLKDVLRIFLFVFVVVTDASYVTITSSGYQDLVVRMEEDPGTALDCAGTLEYVKDLVRETSTTFGTALDRTTYFGRVIIIVPDSWTSNRTCLSQVDTGVNLPWARSHLADVRITPNHPVFGWHPYSFQYGGCYQPGLPINIPYSLNMSSIERGRRLAREWAHYRYGVFDEGGIPDDGLFPAGYMAYQSGQSNTVARPNICAEKKRLNADWNENECSSTIGSGCDYVPDVNNPGIHASLMYRPDLSDMDLFCTKDNHEDGVPSKLNYYCDGLSATEVIYKHPDFTSGVTVDDVSANLTFNVISNPFTGYHIIIDTTSFETQSMFIYALNSLKQFIHFLPEYTMLSVDAFNSTITELSKPICLNDSYRTSISQSLTDLSSGWTPNGNFDGLRDALERSLSRANSGQDVILLTALSTTIPNMNEYVDWYRKDRVNAHLLYFKSQTAKVDLAKLTLYGTFHAIPDLKNVTEHNAYTWAVGVLHSLYSRTYKNREKVFEKVWEKTNSSLNQQGSFYVDGQGSTMPIALYLYTGVDNSQSLLAIRSWTITPPNGSPINILDSPNYLPYGTLHVTTINSTTIAEGLWQYNITLFPSSSNGLIRLDVWVDPVMDSVQQPLIELRTWTSATNGSQAWDARTQPLGLYAQITQARRPVQNAMAYAYVYATDSSGVPYLLEQVPLTDSGIADVTSGDGIYSGFLTRISNTSLVYSVLYEAYSVNSMAYVDQEMYDRPPTTGSSIEMSSPTVATKQFRRFDYGSSFHLMDIAVNGVDWIPPQRVTDLSIASYDGSSGKATLTWTTPRDNYGSGEVITCFKITRTIGTGDPENVFEGTFINGQVKSNETWMVTYNLTVPAAGEGIYIKYRVIGLDGCNNAASSSNIVSVSGPMPYLSVAGSNALMWGLIGAGIALAVILLIILLICCCCPVQARRKKREATRKMKQVFSTDKNKKKDSKKVVASSEGELTGAVPVQQWQSPSISDVRLDHINEGYTTEEDQRQRTTNSLHGSQKIYFGQQEPEQDPFDDDRGVDEVIKRAPSMDLQLATIIMKNSSNLSIDQVGLDNRDDDGSFKSVEARNPTVYARPFKSNAAYSVGHDTSYGGTALRGSRPISQTQSETNLYYTDVKLRPLSGRHSSKSSPTSSYLSVYADQKAEAVPTKAVHEQYQQNPAISNLAATLRAGLRSDQWQDSSSFIYSDPRFDATQPKTTFDPHPANEIGIPTALPSYGRNSTGSLSHLQQSEQQQQPVRKAGSKPSLVSAV